MKQNFKKIMPRLIGTTVVIGLAALIITTLFKLLLGVLALGAVAGLIGKKIASSKNAQIGLNNGLSSTISPMHIQQSWANNVQPVLANAAQKVTTIVPIN